MAEPGAEKTLCGAKVQSKPRLATVWSTFVQAHIDGGGDPLWCVRCLVVWGP